MKDANIGDVDYVLDQTAMGISADPRTDPLPIIYCGGPGDGRTGKMFHPHKAGNPGRIFDINGMSYKYIGFGRMRYVGKDA